LFIIRDLSLSFQFYLSIYAYRAELSENKKNVGENRRYFEHESPNESQAAENSGKKKPTINGRL